MDKKLNENPEIQSVSEVKRTADTKKAINEEKIKLKIEKNTIELIESGAYSKPKKRKSTYDPSQILLPKDNSRETKKKYLGLGKYEREIKVARNVKSLLAGLALSFFAGGTMIFLSKLDALKINPFVFAVIMVGAFFIAWTPVFLLCRVNFNKIAKKLDNRFSLKEKTQSTIETLENDSEMGALLRNDLRKEIEKIDSREIGAFKLIWLYACVFIIASAFILTGAMIPKEKAITIIQSEEKDPIEYFVLSEDDEAKINQIIADVEASNMQEDAKSAVVNEIKNLLNLLKNVKMVKNDAISTVKLSTNKIDKITNDTGSQDELYSALKKQDSAYTREFGRMLTKFSWEKHLLKRADIQALFVHKDAEAESPDLEQMKKDTIKVLNDASQNMLEALESSKVDPSDPLYQLLYRFTTENDPSNKEAKGEGLYGTQEIAEEMEYLSYRWAQKRLEALFSILGEDIYRELDFQNQSYSVGYGAANKIRSMFGIPQVNREDNSEEDEEEDDEEDKNPPEGADGGSGDGLTFAGSDEIYDKDYGRVEYGDVIYTYYLIMQSTEYTPEEKEAIQKYFETLYSDSQQEKGN